MDLSLGLLWRRAHWVLSSFRSDSNEIFGQNFGRHTAKVKEKGERTTSSQSQSLLMDTTSFLGPSLLDRCDVDSRAYSRMTARLSISSCGELKSSPDEPAKKNIREGKKESNRMWTWSILPGPLKRIQQKQTPCILRCPIDIIQSNKTSYTLRYKTNILNSICCQYWV